MKQTLLTALALLALATAAHATPAITGELSGFSTSPSADPNNDGEPGRPFAMFSLGSPLIRKVQGLIDVGLSPTQGCPVGAFEIIPSGWVIFRTWTGDAIYAEIDTTPICSTPGQPEHIAVYVVGGWPGGDYADAIGTGEVVLLDSVLAYDPGPIPWPWLVDSHGSYTLELD